MGLSSVFSTAITGLQGAETTIDVAGNNVANSNTIGFKSSQALFATQFLQTLSLGSAPTTNSGGTNPRQIGLGTQVAAITPNFTQGTMQISSSPSDLAIQGEGFFIVQATTGEQLYTRNGKFQVNSQNELTTLSGARLLGFGVDDNFQIQSTTLQPLSIPLGAAAVAKATENVVPRRHPYAHRRRGRHGRNHSIRNSWRFVPGGACRRHDGHAWLPCPTSRVHRPRWRPESSAARGLLTAVGVYQYKVVFADRALGSLPDTHQSRIADRLGHARRRTQRGRLDERADRRRLRLSTHLPHRCRRLDVQARRRIRQRRRRSLSMDDTADAALGVALAGARSHAQRQLQLLRHVRRHGRRAAQRHREPSHARDWSATTWSTAASNSTIIPVDASGQWSVRRIYRNLATDDSQFHFVAEIPNNLAGESFTDSISDAVIQGNPQIDLDGPRISTNTLLDRACCGATARSTTRSFNRARSRSTDAREADWSPTRTIRRNWTSRRPRPYWT